ncbi:hypothetical protein CTheo_8858 [Ceratobasidium theobromae]|uniref:Transposase family Tnp2 protein n=1 Tax=Ceratobasidium theobromae TaxID=1582974 RepID=A0A5N5Q7F1_9AGAM|nr:hypothetical protein CTheo_8858 [Ceratobasidium theobromae]
MTLSPDLIPNPNPNQMPDHRASTKEKVRCYCGIEEYGPIPHWCHVRTCYRHLAKAKKLAQHAMGDDNNNNNDNNDNNHQMDIDSNKFAEGQGPEDDLDAYTGAQLDDKWLESEPSDAGWDEVEEPARVTSRTPTPPPDDEEPQEDGFEHITKEDYREYDRWFDETIQEMDEIIAENLTEEEMDSIKMMAIRLFGHISQRNYERIRYSFQEKIHLLSSYRLHRKLTILSGISPLSIDCCVNSCHAFTGRYAKEEFCSKCKQACYTSGLRRKACQVFEYLPITPRLQGYFNNPDMVQKMYYRADYTQEEGRMDDYIDSKRYKKLCHMNIVIEGEDLGIRYFHGSRDIAYAVMTDGVSLFQLAHNQKSTCWPIMAINLNLPASERVKLRNLLPLGVIPGPNQPKDFDSFLEPFVQEAIEQACGVETYDVTRRERFTLRAHPIMVSGDMQAMKHVNPP